MKKLIYPIESIYASVETPVNSTVMKYLKAFLRIPNTVHVEFLNTKLDMKNKNWNLGKNTWFEKMGNKHDFLTVSIETISQEEPLPTNYGKPVLQDVNNNFELSTLYSQTENTFTINYFSKDRTNVERVKNKLLMSIKNGERYFNSKIFYTYFLPDFLQELVTSIHGRTNLYKDPTIPLETYLNTISDSRLTIANNQSGKAIKNEIAFKETQAKVMCKIVGDMFNYDLTYDNEKQYWSLELTLRFQYAQPFYFHATYPIMVSNSLLHQKFIGLKDKHTCSELGLNNLKIEEPNTLRALQFKKYFRVPALDTHDPYKDRPFYKNVFSVLTSITNTDKRNLFNLNSIPGITIDPVVIEYIKNNLTSVVQQNNDLITIALYENDKYNFDRLLRVDSDLNVFSHTDLDITKTYRIIFSICTDTTILNSSKQTKIENLFNKDTLFEILSITTDCGTSTFNGTFRSFERNRSFTVMTSKIITNLLKAT